MTILLTGAGFLTKELLKILVDTKNHIRVYSRSQRGLEKVEREFGRRKRLTLIQGDVLSKDDLLRSCQNVDQIIHGAAEKRVDWVERFVSPSAKINILGTDNVCFAAHEKGVKKVLFVSTDKAVRPITAYGSTKHCAEILVKGWNSMSATTDYSSVRYGNVWGSTGSVIELWDKLHAEKKSLSLTHPEMSRFFISPRGAVDFILESFESMKGGETFVPKLKSVKMLDVLHGRYEGVKYEVTGIREKEKIHEDLGEDYCSKDCLVSYDEMKEEME